MLELVVRQCDQEPTTDQAFALHANDFIAPVLSARVWNVEGEDMKSWRSGPDRVLIPRPIKEREWPRLVNAMNEDGLACFITPRGLVWMVGSYRVHASVVREVWGLSESQMRRFRDHIYQHNPWEVEA